MIGVNTAPPPREQLALRRRDDSDLSGRLRRSVRDHGTRPDLAEFSAWFRERARASPFRVDRITFDELTDWSFDPVTGNLGHRTGRFFSVEGLHVEPDGAADRSWHQPIIHQPEVGILGILAKEFDGVLHFLMQAKPEPGNPGLFQLSPTVQATRSNYSRVHRGFGVRYLEYFVHPGRGRVLVDVLQSEHGSWFYRKNNRNIVVEVFDDVPLHDDFVWLTLGQIGALLRRPNLINMDSRSVLACLQLGDEGFEALHSDTELLSWFTAERARREVRAERVPLAALPGWERGARSIDHVDGRYFRVVAVSVQAGSREIARWTQPLIEPVGTGVTAFLARRISGVLHLLAHARVEAGFRHTVELGPTVQCTPASYAHLPADRHPPFLDLVLSADPARIRYDAVHSEEGGRFLDAESRYLVVETAEDDLPAPLPEGYCWLTPAQLTSLARHGLYVNVQARTLLACLGTGAAEVGRT
ncbi:NDP-hexose 2,3-dehydratase family protein [Streptomyces sp. NPDC090021]|uniref:NDP-hexose 2,3-dehydratase family protein n=1 Tax=Streptomyces sp. NPDC090021 TaxID=3365919 RepID=UPI00382030DE